MNDKTKIMGENAINFMMYSYFDVSVKETGAKSVSWNDLKSVKDFIRAAVEKAYQDATLRRAYSGMINQEASQKAKDNCMNYLVNGFASPLETDKIISIYSLITENPEKLFDNNHEIICDKIVEEHEQIKDEDGNKCFTYGNAQKWINMTTKYLYIMAGLFSLCDKESLNAIPDDIKKFCEKIEECSKFFHVPLDQMILRALLKLQSEEPKKYIYANGEGIACSISENVMSENDKKYIYTLVKKGTKGMGVKKVSWSNIGTYKMYDDFRDIIEKAIQSEIPQKKSLIEWECEAWINQSKAVNANQKLEL